MKLPFFIPHSKPTIETSDVVLIQKIVESGFVGKGQIVEKVNRKVEEFLDIKSNFLVNSGSSAIFLALKALKIQRGDEVIISEYGCPSLLNQIINTGAKPIVIDTLINSFFIDTNKVKKSISPNTKALLIHHPFGYFDNGILELKKLGIPIIEDITHSFGATFNNMKVGNIGDIVVASLGSTKFITSGTGGIIGSNRKEIINNINYLLDYDYHEYDYSYSPERYNYALGDINAGLFLAQLQKLNRLINKRKYIAKQYQQLKKAFIPQNFEGGVHYRFFIKPKKEEVLTIIATLKRKGIICYVGGIKLISSVVQNEENINASQLHSNLISIPIYPSLSQEEIDYIIEQINLL